jgi:hypothetical protein
MPEVWPEACNRGEVPATVGRCPGTRLSGKSKMPSSYVTRTRKIRYLSKDNARMASLKDVRTWDPAVRASRPHIFGFVQMW